MVLAAAAQRRQCRGVGIDIFSAAVVLQRSVGRAGQWQRSGSAGRWQRQCSGGSIGLGSGGGSGSAVGVAQGSFCSAAAVAQRSGGSAGIGSAVVASQHSGGSAGQWRWRRAVSAAQRR